MRYRLMQCRVTCLLALAVLLPSVASAVTIYRLGGENLPPPLESGRPGVQFEQLFWDNPGKDGNASRLDMGADGISPQQRHAFSSMPLKDANASQLDALFDWNGLTCGVCELFVMRSYKCGTCQGLFGDQGTINIRLGDALFVERIRIRSGDAVGLGILEDFGLFLSPAPLSSNAGPHTPFTVQVRGNTRRILDLEGFSQERRSASIQLALPEHDNPVVVSEVFVFASGAASAASFTSDIIDFGRPALWGGLRWSLVPAEGSNVSVSARSGDQAQSLRYWRYTGIGDQVVEVTPQEYDALFSRERAGASYDYNSWTPWPTPFDLNNPNGEPPMPGAPRRAFQLRLDFNTAGADGSRMRFVEFRASDPFVTRVVGELEPVFVQAGKATDFSYILKPSMGLQDTGFDRLQISAVAAHIDTVIGTFVDDVEVPYTVEILTPERLRVRIPRVTEDLTDAPVEIRFRARALRYGAGFGAHLLDSRRPWDVAQPVPAGDAVDEVTSDRFWIETKVQVRDVIAAESTIAVVTPNGDGINDMTTISYDLFETTGPVPVTVSIHDLSGRQVRQLSTQDLSIGHYEVDWDGRRDDGMLVRPGIYLFRVVTHVGGGDQAKLGLVNVVY